MTLKPNPNWRGDPTFLPDVFRAFGVPFREDAGWKQWGMGDFNIIQGVFWHHTGARNTSAQYIRYNPGLGNGLSSQLHTDPKGLQTIVGAGIAWHAGRGSFAGWPTNDANRVSIGFEMQHNGTDTWPEAQLDSTRRATAAILWFLGKRATTATMISHWEYSLAAQGKWDPGAGNGRSGATMNMNVQRAEVNKLIDTFNTYGTLNPVPEKDDFMSALTPAEQRELLENSRLIPRVHHELTHEFQSLVEDEHGKRSTWRGTLVGMVQQIDRKVEGVHGYMLPNVVTAIQALFKKENQNDG